MSDMKRLASELFIAIIMMLSYTPLKSEIQSIANNPNMTSTTAQLINKIFPLLWWLLIILVIGLMLYEAVS